MFTAKLTAPVQGKLDHLLIKLGRRDVDEKVCPHALDGGVRGGGRAGVPRGKCTTRRRERGVLGVCLKGVGEPPGTGRLPLTGGHPGMHWTAGGRGGSRPPSQCLPDGKCRLQGHL